MNSGSPPDTSLKENMLKPNQRDLLLQFRDLLKEAGIDIEAKDGLLSEKASVECDWLMTSSDYELRQLAFGIQEPRPVNEFRTTENGQIKKE